MNAVVLPKQVQEQLEEAARIEAQLIEAENAAPPLDGTPPEPQLEPPPPAPPEPAAPAVTVQPSDDWKQKYDVLQGKFNAEVPRLHRELKETRTILQQAMDELTRLRQAEQASPPPEKPEPALVTKQDEEQFGSDLIDLVRRVVKQDLGSLAPRLEQTERFVKEQLPRQVQAVREEVQVTRQERFWSTLQEEVPNWQEVNTSMEWLKWLGEYDPVSGKQRQASLDEAVNSLDAPRTIALFRMFLGTTTAAPPPPAAEPVRNELERQVAPTKSVRTNSTPPARKTYSGKEYAYWTDPRRIHDTDKEKLAAVLNDLETALVEGRIQF